MYSLFVYSIWYGCLDFTKYWIYTIQWCIQVSINVVFVYCAAVLVDAATFFFNYSNSIFWFETFSNSFLFLSICFVFFMFLFYSYINILQREITYFKMDLIFSEPIPMLSVFCSTWNIHIKLYFASSIEASSSR